MTLNAARLSRLKALSAWILLAWSLPTHALTLGKFQVQSAIGEPLRAEVEVTQFTSDELEGLQAQLASPASFRQAGIDYSPALQGVVARIENRNDGRAVITLTGRNPVQDSFIDLILEAQWATGRAVKNYALLLNSANPNVNNRQAARTAQTLGSSDAVASPVPLDRAAAPVVTAAPGDGSLTPSRIDLNANQVPVYRFDTADTVPAGTSVAPPPAPPAVFDAARRLTTLPLGDEDRSLVVRPGDTASLLIMGRLPAHVTQDQMLLALVRANPSAFIEGNVNLVRAGAVLRMPQPDEATQISRAEARQTVLAQNRDFAEYTRRVAQSPLLVGSAQSREMSGTVSTDAAGTTPQGVKQDKLTLSKAQTGDNAAEAKLAAEREAKDAANQLSELNKNMQDLQALAQNGQPATPASSTGGLQPSPSNDKPSWMTQFSQHPTAWLWGLGGLLALVTVWLWSRKKQAATREVFAPSYDDVPPPSMSPMGSAMNIPPQMAGIDLNLNANPTPQASAAPALNEVTEQNKLALASQLLASGDKDLARTLLMSVASSAGTTLRSRAQQMLAQIA